MKLPDPPPGKSQWPWILEPPPEPATARVKVDWPKISIVTPSYNQGAFIESTIRSVLLQGYPNLEYIILDAGSTDNSIEIIRKYEPWISHWTSQKDQGQSDAINKGLSRASGVLANWLNSDDYYLPGALQKVALAYLAVGEEDCAIIGKGRWVDSRGKCLFEHIPPKVDTLSVAGCADNWIPQPAGFFTRKAFWDVGGLQLDLHYAMDFDLYVKLVRCVPFLRLDDCLAVALAHEAAKTRAQRQKMMAEVRVIQFRNGYEDLARQGLEADYRRLIRFQEATAVFRNNPLFRVGKNVLSRVARR